MENLLKATNFSIFEVMETTVEHQIYKAVVKKEFLLLTTHSPFPWYNYYFGFTLWFFGLTYLGVEKPIMQNSRIIKRKR